MLKEGGAEGEASPAVSPSPLGAGRVGRQHPGLALPGLADAPGPAAPAEAAVPLTLPPPSPVRARTSELQDLLKLVGKRCGVLRVRRGGSTRCWNKESR